MFKNIKRTRIGRSFTGDSKLLKKLKDQIKAHPKGNRPVKGRGRFGGDSNTTTNTLDLSSEEQDQPQPLFPRRTRAGAQTISWVRTASMRDPPSIPPSEMTEQQRRQTKMRDLPSTGAFSSNLILVNRERLHRNKDPLSRCRHLDGIATKRASEMALACALLEEPIDSAHMSENVQRGPSIKIIHQLIMMGISDRERNNILDERFRKFGMGTALGEDGHIYMSQIFQASSSTEGASPLSCALASSQAAAANAETTTAKQQHTPQHDLESEPSSPSLTAASSSASSTTTAETTIKEQQQQQDSQPDIKWEPSIPSFAPSFSSSMTSPTTTTPTKQLQHSQQDLEWEPPSTEMMAC